jgi:hypothetical protein
MADPCTHPVFTWHRDPKADKTHIGILMANNEEHHPDQQAGDYVRAPHFQPFSPDFSPFSPDFSPSSPDFSPSSPEYSPD